MFFQTNSQRYSCAFTVDDAATSITYHDSSQKIKSSTLSLYPRTFSVSIGEVIDVLWSLQCIHSSRMLYISAHVPFFQSDRKYRIALQSYHIMSCTTGHTNLLTTGVTCCAADDIIWLQSYAILSIWLKERYMSAYIEHSWGVYTLKWP